MANTREALEALRDSMRLRHTASHALNEASSRSHCIFSLQVHRVREVYKLLQTSRGVFQYVLQTNKTSTLTTRANLVDLAGSEDARETQTSGSTLKEAADINKSLFTLRKAIEHLALKKHTRSVFQEETLTKMLASSLLGQAYSLMIATISPSASALRHTRNTLQYAGTAASISLAAPKAAADDLSLRNAELEKRNTELLKELEQRGKDFSELERKLKELETLGMESRRSDVEGHDDERREEELTALHHQLTALLQSGESGGLFTAQAAAKLGVPNVGAAGLHASQAHLAEARCRERFERRAFEEFLRQSLNDELPPPPTFEKSVDTQDHEGGAMWLVDETGGDGGLAELQARVQMLSNARRSHAEAWESMVRATAERVDALRALRHQLHQPPRGEEEGGDFGPLSNRSDASALSTRSGVSSCSSGSSPLVTPRGRQPSDALRQQSSLLVCGELAREERALASYPQEHAALVSGLIRSLSPLLACVISISDGLGTDTAVQIQEPIDMLRNAATGFGMAAEDDPSGDVVASPFPSLADLLDALEAVLCCLAAVRGELQKRRELNMQANAENLAKTRRELAALQPQREAALRRAEAQHGAERAAMEAELRQARAREEAQTASAHRLQTELASVKRSKREVR